MSDLLHSAGNVVRAGKNVEHNFSHHHHPHHYCKDHNDIGDVCKATQGHIRVCKGAKNAANTLVLHEVSKSHALAE